ncbi:hypothetical protein [Pseudomonas sp. R5(2019)]|uniref:hypothetical protein n=1 Tax=Pseudomonas sp. R5(2019) TaxID=2697566 RepID=UPI0014126B48|nr:hypothetical protein [Pseudomonas sp. R5(2019)]NBA97399.1 hypothetical protein [Pseudomonas sp. R5(2019)]
MVNPLAMPHIPGLDDRQSIDYEGLNGGAVQTFIKYAGMALNDWIQINIRGCGERGEVVDLAGYDQLIEVTSIDGLGQPFEIANDLVALLRKGIIFYSYAQELSRNPRVLGPESSRLVFYVDRPPAELNGGLAVAQCLDSHELHLAYEEIPGVGATLVIPAYQDMQKDQTVRLTLTFWDGDYSEDSHSAFTLQDDDVGHPLHVLVERTKFNYFDFFDLHYVIEYPDQHVISPSQRFQLSMPAGERLPALSVTEDAGNGIDPDKHPRGIELWAVFDSDIREGDEVLLCADAGTRILQSFTVDPTTLASGQVRFRVGPQWLKDNAGDTAKFFYQRARQGAEATSKPLSLKLRVSLDLAEVNVKGATVENGEPGAVAGYLKAGDATGGVEINIPNEVKLPPSASVVLRWAGHSGSGTTQADPEPNSDNRFFRVGPEFVAPNIGKKLTIHYEVTPPGDTSDRYTLEIKDEGGWTKLQCPLLEGGERLPLNKVPPEGAEFTLAAWMYMDVGQRVRMIAKGPSGIEDHWLRRDVAVTEDEWFDDQISERLPREFLESLTLNSKFTVTVWVSFDEGATYVHFHQLTIQLVA